MMGLSPAGTALMGMGGFGGTALTQQVAEETEEEKKRRQLGMSALQSPAARALLAGSPF
jgi:hypothetical protein